MSEMVDWSRCRFSWPEPTSTVVERPEPNDAESMASHLSWPVSETSPLMSGPAPHFMYNATRTLLLLGEEPENSSSAAAEPFGGPVEARQRVNVVGKAPEGKRSGSVAPGRVGPLGREGGLGRP